MFNAQAVTEDIVQWIIDYFKSGASPETKAVVGVSGGKDSSVVLALCVRALGRERVLGVLMPQGTQEDIDVSYDICRELGVDFVEVNIGSAVQELYGALQAGGIMLNKIVTSNTPARLRMSALYAVSASVGGRVANTSNYSEDWVGYATKFGDSAGDFSPLSKLTVAEVKAVGRVLGLPERFVEKVPIDGLSGLTDEDNLGFSYETLDRYIREGIEPDAATRERIDRLHRGNLHKLQPLPMFMYSPD